MKKLDEAKRRFGMVTGGYTGDLKRDGTPLPDILGHDWPRFGVHSFLEPHSVQRLKAEVQALQELLNQKDMEIDFLATARPTVLRLDWYLIGLVALMVAVHEVGWL